MAYRRKGPHPGRLGVNGINEGLEDKEKREGGRWCMAQMGRRCPPPRVTPLPSRLDAAVVPPGDQPEWRRSANRARGDGRKKSPSYNSSTS